VATIDELIIGDEPDVWAAAGFTVDPDGVCRVGSVRLRLAGRAEGKRIYAWTVRDMTVPRDGGIDGLPTFVVHTPLAEPAKHDNGVLYLDHVVLATPDLARTTAALEACGLEPRRTRDSDTYGAPMRQVFFRMGEVILEVIGAPEAAGDGPAGFFGLAYTVDDLDATKAFFGDAVGTPKPAVQPGRRIATLRHKELGLSVATAFMSAGDQEYG